ncbi:hypothetical protein HGRIS_007148 [Hohenbuehelia grisea]|uniref:RBR-type E3 ubiquitin transferase n=1 Tax=Hohenbuehelia grisea TaxID=104357 RepID=A0ABR3JBQ8_9AGAR
MADPDPASAALIAHLALQDILTLTASRKGKQRADAPPTDEEYAIQLQEAQLQDLLQALGDLSFAQTIDAALDSDQDYVRRLEVAERCARDDRRAAEALESGRAMPEQTAFQRAVGDRRFRFESEDDEVGSNNATDGRSDIIDEERDETKEDVGQPQVKVEGGLAQPNEYGGRSQPSSGGISQTKRPTNPIDCVACTSTMSSPDLQAPCGHAWCRSCLTDLVRACIKDETLYPLRCCQQHIPERAALGLITDRRVNLAFRLKAREFATPALQRVYCPNPRCSVFLGASLDEASSGSNTALTHGSSAMAFGETTRRCTSCYVSACLQCKSAAHPGESCKQNEALEQVKALAASERWQTCPGCHAIVELHHGCYHMSCRCRTQFCYLCAAPWKTCACPQWDEGRLLRTAQQRVTNELGAARAARVPTAMLWDRVRRQADELRNNHDCAQHNWTYRHGGGRCEECHFNLPSYLLVCRGCHLLACVRCARNRL